MNFPHPSLVSAETAPYWEGLRKHRLLLQHCADCGRARHYPRPMCDACYSMRSDWKGASGRGTIHTWTVCHHPFNFFFKASAPYVVALVEMDAGVRVNAPLRGIAEADIRIGQRVKLGFEPVTNEITLPFFVAG